MIELGLSFLEGLALIASPCILPVLPLVLGASIEGGVWRPFGIIAGFVLAFTAFALLSRKLVIGLGLDLDLIKYGSLLLLALFGMMMLSEKLSARFSAWTGVIANAGNQRCENRKDGFFSGMVIGALIGLVWTPCAGPILAAVLVQVIRQESDIQALFLLSAFALGASVPMLVISLSGRKLMKKLAVLSAYAGAVRKAFGVVILLAVIAIAAGSGIRNGAAAKEQAVTRDGGLQDALAEPYPAPEFTGLQAWLNAGPLTMASLKGKVVLVDFWTYSCINCVRTLPYVTRWDRTYRDKGLVVIGIHAPEFEFEKSKENVAGAIATHHIEYPVALDNRLDTWTAFRNRYWPAHYLIDRQGKVVYTHFGEGNYAETENNIRYLLGLDRNTKAEPEQATTSRYQSPETYLGHERAANFVSPEPLTPDATHVYSVPKFIPADHWALAGDWHVGPEHITAAKAGAVLQYNFTAAKVFLVMGTKEGVPVKATLTLNGAPVGTVAGKDAPGGVVTVDKHTLYELVGQGTVKNGLLEITASAPGLEAYAFTFGN